MGKYKQSFYKYFTSAEGFHNNTVNFDLPSYDINTANLNIKMRHIIIH